MIEKIFKKYEMEYRDWAQVVGNLESILEPEVLKDFQKIYRQFNSYKSRDLLVRMYDFIYSENIQYHVNSHRVPRLKKIWDLVVPFIKNHQIILDVGAGTGIISEAIRESFKPEILHVCDISSACCDHLKEIGFEEYSEYIKYDVLLMIDCLGEINMDEDEAILESLESSEMQTGEILEERYGFATQLEKWKSALTPSSVILFFEPFSDSRIFGHLKFHLNSHGWQVDLINPMAQGVQGLILQLAED